MPTEPAFSRKKLRQAVWERAKFRCEYCLWVGEYSSQYFELDHIYPAIKGGESVLENLACACSACNNHKYTKTQAVDPNTGEFAPLFNPRTDVREIHFTWNLAFTHLIGLTPIGRATIEALKLNRPGLVNLRRLAASDGKHSPPLSL